jgi:hypothetical protein
MPLELYLVYNIDAVEIVVSGRKLLGNCHVERVPRKGVECSLEDLERQCPDATVQYDTGTSHQFLHNPDSLEDGALKEWDKCFDHRPNVNARV